ncbi:MAG: hypothetical protein FK734_10115 [Asgard group archaeon]|nr:hypothetical protein [Asgard group archaeon]
MKWDSKLLLVLIIVLPMVIINLQPSESLQDNEYVGDHSSIVPNYDIPNSINSNYTEIAQWDDDFLSAYKVMIIDEIAFYTDIKQGLILLDISNKSDLKVIGNYKKTHINCFYVTDEYIYLGGEPKWNAEGNDVIGIEVLDYSDPTNIVRVAQFIDIRYVNEIFVKDRIVFTLDRNFDGLVVVDFSNLEKPTKFYSYNEGNNNYDTMTTNGQYLVIAKFNYEDPNEFFLFDITDRTNPQFLKEFTVEYIIKEIFIDENNYLYLIHRSNDYKIFIYDITSPTPILLTTFVGDNPYEIYVKESIAYICGYDYFTIYDLGNITNPHKISQIRGYIFYPKEITVKNNYCFIASGNSGLLIVDVQNTSSPILINKYGTSGQVKDVVIKNKIAYLADSYAGIKVINFTDTFNPEVLCEYDDFNNYEKVAIQDNLLLAIGYNDILVLFDIQNPCFIQKVFECYLTSLTDAIIENNLIYATGGNFIKIFNCSNPTNVTQISSFYRPYLSNTGVIKKLDNYLFINGYNSHLSIFNVSNLLNISFVSELEETCTDFDFQNNLIYGVYDENLYIIDFNNISNPVLVDEYLSVFDNANSIVVKDNIAYITCSPYDDYGLLIFDITDSANIKTIGNCLEGRYYDIEIDNELFYLAKYDLGVAVAGKDTDNDFLADIAETYFGTDMNDKDTDNDWIDDGIEVKAYGTNPILIDTDGDRYSDAAEIYKWKTDPLDKKDKPNIFEILYASGGLDYSIILIMILPSLLISIPSFFIKIFKTRRTVEKLTKKNLRGAYWIKLRTIILWIVVLIQSLTLFIPKIYLRNDDYLRGSLQINIWGTWIENFSNNLNQQYTFSGLNTELGNYSPMIPYLMIASMVILFIGSFLFIPQSSLFGRIDKKLENKDDPIFIWRIGSLLILIAGIIGITAMGLFTAFGNTIKDSLTSQYDSSYIYHLKYRPSFFFNFVVFSIGIIIGLFTLIHPGRKYSDYLEGVSDIDELVKGSRALSMVVESDTQSLIKKERYPSSSFGEIRFINRRKIYPISSLWKYVRNRMIIFFASQVFIAVTLMTIGFVFIFRSIGDIDNIIIWGVVAIMGPILLLFYMNTFTRPMMGDLGSVRSARNIKNVNYLELVAKELTVGRIFISRPFFTYGFWRRRLAIGALCDIGTKEAISILLEIEKEKPNKGINKLLEKAIGSIYYKNNLPVGIDLLQAYDKELILSVEETKPEKMIDTSISYWEKQFKRGRIRFALILCIVYIIVGLILIIVDAIVRYFYFGFGLGGLMFILGSIVLIVFTISYTKVKNLKDSFKENELLKLLESKNSMMKSFAIIALVDLKSEKALPLIKKMTEEHLDVPMYQNNIRNAYNELLVRLNRKQ